MQEFRALVLAELRKQFPPQQASAVDVVVQSLEDRVLRGVVEKAQSVPFLGDMLSAALAKAYAAGARHGYEQGIARARGERQAALAKVKPRAR